MTRVPYLDNDVDLNGEALAVFEHIKASRGNVIGVFALLLNSPPVAKLVADLGAYLRFDSILSPRLKELVILVTLSENSCQFEWSFHEGFALDNDISQQIIEIIKFKKPLFINEQPTTIGTELSAADISLIRYIRELINNKRVSQACFDELKNNINTQQLTEITALIGYYSMVSCQLNAYQLPAEAGKPSLPEPVFISAAVVEEID